MGIALDMVLDDFISIFIGKRMILGDLRARQRPPKIIRFPMEIDVKSSRAMPRAMPIPGPRSGKPRPPSKKILKWVQVPRGAKKDPKMGQSAILF